MILRDMGYLYLAYTQKQSGHCILRDLVACSISEYPKLFRASKLRPGLFRLQKMKLNELMNCRVRK